jgi:hypothetical protein
MDRNLMDDLLDDTTPVPAKSPRGASPFIEHDLIKQYLHEIGERELLTFQEEFYLGIVIQAYLLIGIGQDTPSHFQPHDPTKFVIKLYPEILKKYDQFLEGVTRLSMTPPSLESFLWEALAIQFDPLTSSRSDLLDWLKSGFWTRNIDRSEADQECAVKAVEILSMAYLLPGECLERMEARTSRASPLVGRTHQPGGALP